MRLVRTLRRMALGTAPALAAALLIPLTASAVPASVAKDLCNFASNKPARLQAELISRLQMAGFTGLPPNQCGKFVKSLVKSCIKQVTNSTQCFVNINATVGMEGCEEASPGGTTCSSSTLVPLNISSTFGKFADVNCDTQPDKASQKSCKNNSKQTLKNNQAVANETVQLLGENTCNQSFAAVMTEICLEGVTPP